MRLQELLARRIAHVPVTAQERTTEVLLEHPDQPAVGIEHLMAATELEHRLRLDHEKMLLAVLREAEPDVLLDLHLLLLHIEQRRPFLAPAGGGHADPILVRDRLEN